MNLKFVLKNVILILRLKIIVRMLLIFLGKDYHQIKLKDVVLVGNQQMVIRGLIN